MFPAIILAVLSFVVLANAASDHSVSFRRSNTSITLAQCEIVRLTWEKGVPPYNVTVLDGQTIIETVLSKVNFLGYLVTPDPGSQLSFVMVDANGTGSAGGPYLVVAGSDPWCVRHMPIPFLPHTPPPSTSNSRTTSSTTTSSSRSATHSSSSFSSSSSSSCPPSPSHSLSKAKPVPQGGHVSPGSKVVFLVPKSYLAERVPDRSRSPWSSRH